MGLRCSLLGHDYGETTTEREREEQGGEVVVVERELQICDRCGSEKVLSENTEVRTLEQGRDDVAPDPAAGEAESGEPSVSQPTDESVASGAGVDASTGATPAEHAPSADEDDAVILEDEPGQPRDRGQWPDDAQEEAMAETADTGEPEPEPDPWPDQSGEDEGFDAKPNTDDGEEAGDFDFGGGLTPESADTGEPGEEGYVEAPSQEPESPTFETASEPSSPAPQAGGGAESASQAQSSDDSVADPGFTSAGPVNPPEGRTDDADTSLVCPECGFERRAARASLRAGDICPECRKGYLAERR